MAWLPMIATALVTASPSTAVPPSPAIAEHLTPKAWVYAPKTRASPAPLIVLLHGSGGDARNFLEQFKREADRRGIVLLSLQSSGRTWPQRPPNDGEPDVVNLDDALEHLSATVPFDRERTALIGFSDGASYALSLGLAYPSMFRTIVAFSPGFAFAPSDADTTQRIFITHSRRDPILPASNVRDMIKGLESAGYSPEVHWFNGGHEIDPDLKKAALDFANGAARTPQ